MDALGIVAARSIFESEELRELHPSSGNNDGSSIFYRIGKDAADGQH